MSTTLSCGVDALPGSITGSPVVQICRPAPKGELWEVTIEGLRKFGPATKEECEAFADQFNRPPLTVAESVESGGTEDLPSFEDSLRFTVLLVPLRQDLEWSPKGSKTVFPTEHANLPFSIAVELAEFLNGIERRVKKGKRAIVSRRIRDSKGRWSVLTVQGTIDPISSEVLLPGLRKLGATLTEAIQEVERINREIIEYSKVPKVWAVIALEESSCHERPAGVPGEAVLS